MESIRMNTESSYSSSSSSGETSDSHSTAPTSPLSSQTTKQEAQELSRKYAAVSYPSNPDLSPLMSCYPRSSVDTYTSAHSDDELDDDMEDCYVDEEACAIPPLPTYRGEAAELYIRPSNPVDFAKLFPSLNRLSIRHDEYTSDGNLNLRIDTSVAGPGHRRVSMQLFHLRMYDLAKREFSLRRYSRDSGREVCSTKRRYQEPGMTVEGRPTLQRSVSSALKHLGSRTHFRRTSLHGHNGSADTTTTAATTTTTDGNSKPSSSEPRRPRTSSSNWDPDWDIYRRQSSISSLEINPHFRQAQPARPIATNTIKLEFSNYARVDVTRRGSSRGNGKKSTKRYAYEWWGHKYEWKRHVDKTLGTVSFHLLRDGDVAQPVAHIVPETRTPSQVHADEVAGGWVPPCHMWISDESVLGAMTDVADVIMATGLIALIDDCIKEKWQVKKTARLSMPARAATTSPRGFGLHLFHRRDSEQAPSPLKIGTPVAAY